MRVLMAATTVASLLSACASPAPAPTMASAANPPAQACHREVPTGSNTWHTVCERPSAEADNRRAVEAVQDAVQHSPATRPGANLKPD